MAAQVQIPYRPLVAQAVSVQVHFALQKPGPPFIDWETGVPKLTFTREALGQWLVGMCYSAEIAAQAAKLRGPDDRTVGVAEDAAHEAYADDQGTPKADMVEAVPPRIAASWVYLATARIVKRVAGGARKAPAGTPATITHGEGGIVPEGGGQLPPAGPVAIPVPGLPPLPFPVPGLDPSAGPIVIPGIPSGPIVIPGVPFFGSEGPGQTMSFAVPAGVLALIGVGFAIAAAAYVARDALVASEVELTKRREIEVAAQVKVSSEVCAANAAIGKPCDVPDVVRSLAKEEHREHLALKYGVPIVIGGLAVGGGVYAARRAGWL